MSDYLIPLGFVAVVFVWMFALMRSGRVKEKYVVAWGVLGVVVFVLAIFRGILPWLTHVMGFEVPSNLVFFAAVLLFLVVSVQFSIELSAQEEKARRLAEEVALLRAELDRRADGDAS